jgi:phosphoadenosine phosphosulfate reductase
VTRELFCKIENAILTLKQYEPPEGYYVAFSGGKDSVVILDLVRRAGVKHDAHMNITSVDPPELTAFVKNNYPDVERHRPDFTMFQIIEKNSYLPTPMARFCCAVLKERGGSGRVVITGIRKAESFRRSKRAMFEISKTDKTKKMIHIIIDWSDKDVWEYIKQSNMPYCKLYDEGWKRIGCIGCPMTSKKERIRQFNLYPNHKKAYINAIKRGLAKKPSRTFDTAEEYFDWWISNMSISKYKALKEQTDWEPYMEVNND